MLTALDYPIIGVYLLVAIAIGVYCAKKEKSTSEYFLAGKDIGWIAIGASLFSTNISSEHFVGLAGSGATSGLAVGHFEWLACVIVLVLGWLFVPFYLRSGVFTMPEFLERRYSKASRKYLATVSIFAYVVTKISVSIYAGSLILNLIAGWNMWTSAILLVVATGLYTVVGGLKAVIYTDLVQACVLIVGAVIMTYIGLDNVEGFAGLRANLPEDFFHMIKPVDHPDFPWTGIFFGVPILGIWYWCTDQVIVQRTLAAKNLDAAQRGTIFAGFLKILPVFLLVVPGMVAKVLYPEVTGDSAFPTLVVKMLPVGVRGLMIAALLAAIMSSLSSVFNSTSTIVTMDFYKSFKPTASDQELVNVGRVATALLVVVGILWIPLMKYISSQLFVYLQSVQAYLSAPVAMVFIVGLFWPRANAQGAIASLGAGAVIGGLRFVLEIVHGISPFSSAIVRSFVKMNFLHFAILLFVLCFGIMVAVSLLTPAPDRKAIEGYTWAFRTKEVQHSQGRRINLWASILLLITVISLWIWFR